MPSDSSIFFTHSPQGSLTIGFSEDGTVPETAVGVIENEKLSNEVPHDCYNNNLILHIHKDKNTIINANCFAPGSPTAQPPLDIESISWSLGRPLDDANGTSLPASSA
ncbi:hypothetical protein HPP92_020855 [Vanilla planifolia]|uniref:Chalcone-flavonone isomerase family protein n=1 Tax=Vanilla planifolia TaxID=51239 RepID=A0A835PYU1_VANPL|nr:hypothetical protein HPP92_020855 [Vanilla planifolia]